MSVAKEYLSTSVENLREIENLEIALRVYGHQSPVTSNYQDCEDTKLEVPFGVNNVNAIKSKIREIQKQKGQLQLLEHLNRRQMTSRIQMLEM